MINGQLNAVSMQAVTPAVVQETAVPVAGIMDGAQQSGGNFAELLSGIQSPAMPKSLPDAGQTEQLPIETGAENLMVDLLAGLSVLPQMPPTLEAVETETEEVTEKTEVSDVTATQSSESTFLASQMAMVLSAYSQPDRMSDVNNLTTLPSDTLQKIASVSEQPAVISAPPAMKQPKQVPVELQLPATENGSQPAKSDIMSDVNKLTTPLVDTLQKVASVSEQPVVLSAPPVMKQPEKLPVEVTENGLQSAKSDRMSDVNKLTTPPVASLQKVDVVSEQPAVISAPPAMKQPELVPAEQQSTATENTSQQVQFDRMSDVNRLTIFSADTLQKVTAVSEQPVPLTATENAPQQVKSDRMLDVNRLTTFSSETVQKAAAVLEQPELISASPEKNKVEPVLVESVKASVVLPAIPAAITVPDEPIVLHDANQHANSGERLAAPLTASAPTPSLEAELEIQLSQPQPITARLTTAAVIAGNRSAALVQEQRSVLNQLNPEQQIEKVRTASDLNNAKEVEPSLKNAESASELTLGSGTSQGGEGSQGQSGSTSDNQTLAQNMNTQLGSEHQKVSSLSTKAAIVEPVRQDVPEQIMQQVKERLVLHDVKPGSQEITLTLSPDSLGELKMNLNLQGQKLSVEIVTENRSVRDIIVQHADALKESLARQNITMESFDVTTGGKGSGNQGQNQNAWRELAKQQQQQQSWLSPRGYQVAQADIPSGQAAYQRQQGQSMLDIHY